MSPRLGAVHAANGATPGPEQRLRSLLAANAAIASDLTLQVLLHRIVDAARALVGARYAALGVVGRNGGLEEFVHAGIDDDTVRRIGHLPRGRGILGLLTTHPTPLRLSELAAHSASVGLPAHHPEMSRFLGVPIRVRDVVFGNLHLTEPVHDGGFTADDEAVVIALAATAGVAIQNARLYDESERRRRWLTAAGTTTRLLLSAVEPETDLLIVEAVAAAAEADVAFLARPTGNDRMVIGTVVGASTSSLHGRVVAVAGSLSGAVFSNGSSVLSTDDLLVEASTPARDAYGPAVGVPLVVNDVLIGALCVVRHRDRHQYTAVDLELIEGFAAQAALALELGRSRAAQQELNRLADRDRIARDLHDHVIQELYALGMGLQQMIRTTTDVDRADRLDAYVDTVDATIRRIRTTIFDLTPLDHDAAGLQAQVLDAVEQQRSALGFAPAVVFVGALDAVGDPALTADVLAVVREGLANCARHAAADRVEVSVAVSADTVTVEVCDDGRGLADMSARSSGLTNLRHRARARGGGLDVVEAPGGGAHLTWTARLAPRRVA